MTRHAIDQLLDRIDRLLSAGEFRQVDDLFGTVAADNPPLVIRLGLLSITRPASRHLPAREAFFRETWAVCEAAGRDAAKLLDGLRGVGEA